MLRPVCEMCGSDDVTVRFFERTHEGMHSKDDRLVCNCKRCGYAFVSKTLEQIKKDKE